MRTKFLLIALVAVIIGLGACGGGGDDASSEKDIVSFTTTDTDGTVRTWDISGTNISTSYAKGTVVGTLAPVVVVSDKASVNPASGTPSDKFEQGVAYTVTAEDGSTKVYTAKATVSQQ